jgi:hypothetical protein
LKKENRCSKESKESKKSKKSKKRKEKKRKEPVSCSACLSWPAIDGPLILRRGGDRHELALPAPE